MKAKTLTLSLLCSFLFTAAAFSQVTKFKTTLSEAQENNQEVRIVLKNGNTFVGLVESIDDESVAIETRDGLFNFKYDRISEISIVDPDDPTSGWYENPAANKLFITQSGRMHAAKTGYYQNSYIFFSTLSYGITRNITVSGGISMIPGIGFEEQLKNLAVKVGTNISPNLSVSGTATYYQLFDTEFDFTSLFGAVTYSKNRLDLTGGLGVATAEGSTTDPILIVGGQFRVSEKFALLSENFVFPTDEVGTEPFLMFGGRFIGQRIAADLGFLTSSDIDGLVPFVSFAVKL